MTDEERYGLIALAQVLRRARSISARVPVHPALRTLLSEALELVELLAPFDEPLPVVCQKPDDPIL